MPPDTPEIPASRAAAPLVQPVWKPDVLEGFECTTLAGLSDASGPIDAALVRVRRTGGPNPGQSAAPQRAVLYLHGYVDYFFQAHLADFYQRAGVQFYALDLRRHGRALRNNQRPNYTSDLGEYLQDVDAAITLMREQDDVRWIALNGHSTGGLVAALYGHRGVQREAINAIVLNSPFLEMNLPLWQQRFAEPMLAAIGRVWTSMPLPGLSRFYGRSLHRDHGGEWDFDKRWKPMDGFGVYAGWFRAIHRAHAEVAAGLDIRCPVLLMHSERSGSPRTWNEDVHSSDIVLNVKDMVRLAPKLGRDVERVAVPGGMHDLVLSRTAVRAGVFQVMGAWLQCQASDV
jgi:alpha-beta hydrolase superfamily lysophospholipase